MANEPSATRNVVTVSTTYSVLPLSDDVILAVTTSAGFTITLPLTTAVGVGLGRRFMIINNGTSNTATVAASGAETIVGSATYTGLSSQYYAQTFISDNAGHWFIAGATH